VLVVQDNVGFRLHHSPYDIANLRGQLREQREGGELFVGLWSFGLRAGELQFFLA